MDIINVLAGIFDVSPANIHSVFGGDINKAYKIITGTTPLFVKVNDAAFSRDMFEKEAKGLKTLKDTGHLNVPDVVDIKTQDKYTVLVLQWIEPGNRNKTTNGDIARQLSNLHNSKNDYFGLSYDNYLGTLNQINGFEENWLDFYFKNRIEYQIQLAIDSGLMGKHIIAKVDKMFSSIAKDYPVVIPSLLHGDLWGGNYMIAINGKAVFIDPAIYYGYREMDIAMMKLFGGFDKEVFDLYNESMPLDYDWQSRLCFHQLYYILAHVNLFGGGYVNSAVKIIEYYSG